MAELEHELRALAARVELPPERDLVPAVRARLPAGPRRSRRRALAVVLASLLAALGVAFAVPPARSAILRFFGLEGVSIVRVEKLPPVATGPAAVGRRLPLREAEREVGFRVLLPDIGSPAGVYVDPNSGLLVVLYGRPTRLRLDELTSRPGMFEKLVGIGEHVERLRVNGGPGVWVGGRHAVSEFFGQPRISASALLWEQGGLTLRLEGQITKAEAIRIAESVRPR